MVYRDPTNICRGIDEVASRYPAAEASLRSPILVGNPTTKGGMQKWKLSRNTYTLHTRLFARFGADLYARSMLINKNFCVGAQEEVY